MLQLLEDYLDTVPRANCEVEEVGPFRLFVPREPGGHPYYARPLRDSAGTFEVADLTRLYARQDELGVPRAIEWLIELHPELGELIAGTGEHVENAPLLLLDTLRPTPVPDGYSVRTLSPDDPTLAEVVAAIGSAFGESDEVRPDGDGGRAERLAARTLRMVGVFDPAGAAVGGGSHSPRGQVTELTGIAVLPRARQLGIGTALSVELVRDAHQLGVTSIFLSAASRDALSVYERAGFARVATSGIAGGDPTD